MHRAASATAVVDLNIARRSDLFAPRPAQDLDNDMATVPEDFLQFTTTVRYASGRTEGPVTVRLPEPLIQLGPVERAVVAYVCTRYVCGQADGDGAVTFALHDLAQWIGWSRPNARQYDRLEVAVEAVATVRFVQWRGYVEAMTQTRGGRPRYERVDVTSIFGFCDEADIETRARVAARRTNENLAANACRVVRLWINRRFRQQLNAGVSVRMPLSALQRIGLKNQLAAHLYYLLASKRTGTQPVEVSDEVLDQVVRPTASWRGKLRGRAEAACRLISAADPSISVSVNDTAVGRWKVVAVPTTTQANSSAFGVPAPEVRGSSPTCSGLRSQKFGVAVQGQASKPKLDKRFRSRSDHRAYSA